MFSPDWQVQNIDIKVLRDTIHEQGQLWLDWYLIIHSVIPFTLNLGILNFDGIFKSNAILK